MNTKVGFGQRAARGAATTAAGQAAKFILQIGSVVTLSHLLSPNDFGLVAMVVAVTAVGEVLRDFGLSSAAIQAPTITLKQRSNLFWLNWGIGATLTCICVAAAPLVADLYGRDELVSIMQVLSITFLLSGASTQFRAHLVRNLRFKPVVAAEVLSLSCGIAFAVVLAVGGFGYWAIVGQQLVQVGGFLLIVVACAKWMPGLPSRHAGMRDLISFGWNLMAAQLLQYLSRNVDSIVIGAQFGAGQLGHYNRASQLVTKSLNEINAPASAVAIPVLSRLGKERERWTGYLLQGQEIMLAGVVPIFTFCAAFADHLVPSVLGDQWNETVPIFRILAVAALFQAAAYATYWVFVSTGNTKSLLRYALSTRVIAVSLIIGAGFISVEAVAGAYLLGLVCFWPMGLYWVHRVADAPAFSMWISGLRAIIIYGGASSVAAISVAGLGLHGWAALLLGGLMNIALLAAVAAVSGRYRASLKQILHAGDLIRKK